MKNLKFFEQHTQYATYINSPNPILPNVSYCVDNNEVHYNPIDYSKTYLTFKALEDGTFTLTIPTNVNATYMTSVSYSVDDGETWTTTNVDSTAQTITTPTINAGDVVLWKGIGKTLTKGSSSDNFSCFSSTGDFDAYGNMMSLLYGDGFANQTTFPSGNIYQFAKLFFNATTLINAANIALPATTLAQNCYSHMFSGCTALTTAPSILPATTLADNCCAYMFNGCTALTTAPSILPATTLADNCYLYMFRNCTSLTTAPVLPATTLAQSCYYGMFSGCTSLTTAPELPATTLTNYCYEAMFIGCGSLTTAPVLNATALADYCYEMMFKNCTSLNYIKMLATDISAAYCLNDWVSGVAASGTFVKNIAATWTTTGVNGVPSGWTVQTASE